MRLLFWYSGEHPTMPQAEARAAFEACGHGFEVVADRPRFQCVDTDAFGGDAFDAVSRLGLTHDVSSHLFDAAPSIEELRKHGAACCLDEQGSFAVRAERIGPDPAMRRTEAERAVGAVLAPGRRVDLLRPDTVIRAFVDRERLWAGKLFWDRDPKETAARHLHRRPRFSPVSLPPKLARALLNLARVPPGGTVVDPVCGTGGILLEAAAMGFRVAGSDLDPRMVDSTRANLAHFGHDALALKACDVGMAPDEIRAQNLPPIDAVVMDLPYGRSASTGKESKATLYDRAFDAAAAIVRPGGYVVGGVPSEAAARRTNTNLTPVELFQVRVHRSLTRHFAVLRRSS